MHDLVLLLLSLEKMPAVFNRGLIALTKILAYVLKFFCNKLSWCFQWVFPTKINQLTRVCQSCVVLTRSNALTSELSGVPEMFTKVSHG